MGRPVLLDGAMGTSLWDKAEKLGYKKDPVWVYNLTHPEIVKELLIEYANAGTEMIQANTFGANIPVVQRVGYDYTEVLKAAVKIGNEVKQEKAVQLSVSFGPLSMMLEPFGDLEEDECYDIYYRMFKAVSDAGGVDVFILETFMDKEMMRLAASAAKQFGVPVFCSMTYEKVGKTMMGNSVQQVIETLEPLGIDAIGMNCSLGPDLALPILKEYRENTKLPLYYKPNAGKPVLAADGSIVSPYTAEMFAAELAPAFRIADYIGGCCGTAPEYIKLIRTKLEEEFK